MRLKVTALMITPVMRTKSRLGSQLLFSSRKPYIFPLCDIPAIISPKPNRTPIRKSNTFEINDFSFSFAIITAAMTKPSPRYTSGGIDILSRNENYNCGTLGMCDLRERVAVARAVLRKTTTAVSDRTDKRGIPHNPCPEVQPFDRSVPIPTSSPATMRCETELEESILFLSKGKDMTCWNYFMLS